MRRRLLGALNLNHWEVTIMKDMTLTQEYFICAVNGKGKISGFSTEKQVCLVAAGLLELQMEGCICIDKKQVGRHSPAAR